MSHHDADGEVGTVYLLHFDRRYKHAGHYLGWTMDLPSRLAEHAAGRGARLLEVVREAGIGWQLTRTWVGPRARERQLKRQGGRSRCCPQCGIRPRDHHGMPDGLGSPSSGSAEAIERARRAVEALHRDTAKHADHPGDQTRAHSDDHHTGTTDQQLGW